MGIGLFVLCRGLAGLETGRPARILRATGSLLVVPFLVLTVVYAVPEAWTAGAAEWAALADEPEPTWMVVALALTTVTVLVGWMTVSTLVARSEHWPTWLGVVFGLFGLATVATQLPLFAALGAIVLGVTVRRRSPARPLATPAGA